MLAGRCRLPSSLPSCPHLPYALAASCCTCCAVRAVLHVLVLRMLCQAVTIAPLLPSQTLPHTIFTLVIRGYRRPGPRSGPGGPLLAKNSSVAARPTFPVDFSLMHLPRNTITPEGDGLQQFQQAMMLVKTVGAEVADRLAPRIKDEVKQEMEAQRALINSALKQLEARLAARTATTVSRLGTAVCPGSPPAAAAAGLFASHCPQPLPPFAPFQPCQVVVVAAVVLMAVVAVVVVDT